jgi:hypothetical protein
MNAAALQSAEILVRFANPAEDGRKPSIKTSDGLYFGVTPADFGRFQPGGRYRVEFTERIWRGKTYRDIKSCEPIRSASASSGDERAPSPQASRSRGEGASAEIGFITRMLAARVASCGVEWSAEALTKEIRFLRGLFRQAFGE